MIYFETDRLRMRAFETKDLLDFKKMNEDPEVMKYFPKILTHEETTAFYRPSWMSFNPMAMDYMLLN